MLKKNKWGMILSSLVILLPIGVGLLLWDQLLGFLIFIFVLGVQAGDQHAEPMDDQQNGGHQEYALRFVEPAIHLTGKIPMEGQLLGQLRPQDDTGQNGQQDHHGCDNQGL